MRRARQQPRDGEQGQEDPIDWEDPEPADDPEPEGPHVPAAPDGCDIGWQPSVLAPVFYGVAERTPGDESRVLTGLAARAAADQETGRTIGKRRPAAAGRMVAGSSLSGGHDVVSEHTTMPRQTSTHTTVGMDEMAWSFGPPGALRIFFPSLDGAVWDAPILAGCGRYPLVVLLHGNCVQTDHYKRWFDLPAQLARSGYIVAVPHLRATQDGTSYPWTEPHPDLTLVQDTIEWLRESWEHRDLLMDPQHTAVIGHSYGGLLAARLAQMIDAAAYVSLSAVWADWPLSGEAPSPLTDLDMPVMFCWGTGLADNEPWAVVGDSTWSQISAPKHKVVFETGNHWEYLPEGSSSCQTEVGDCSDRMRLFATDYVTTFLSKYLPPESWSNQDLLIPDRLVPPDLELTFDQLFFKGAFLPGLSNIPAAGGCDVTHTWTNATGATGSHHFPG